MFKKNFKNCKFFCCGNVEVCIQSTLSIWITSKTHKNASEILVEKYMKMK